MIVDLADSSGATVDSAELDVALWVAREAELRAAARARGFDLEVPGYGRASHRVHTLADAVAWVGVNAQFSEVYE
jgi:hypothetical protein